MIWDIILDKQSLNTDSDKHTAKVSYLIVTDFSDNFSVFTTADAMSRLPQYGNFLGDTSFIVKDISYDRRDQSTFNTNGKYPANGKYALWDYTISCEMPRLLNIPGRSGVNSKIYPWEQDRPLSFSVEPVFYEEFTNKHYSSEDINGIPTAYAYNAAGDPVYYTRKLVNIVLNFTYAVKKFDVEWIQKYVNTVNVHREVICGYSKYANTFKIIGLSAKAAVVDNENYYLVDAKVEVGMDKPVYGFDALGVGFNAKVPTSSTDSTLVKRRIQTATEEEYTAMLADTETYPNAIRVWKDYGFYNSNEGSRYISEPIVLNTSGEILQQEFPNMESPDVNKVSILESCSKDWTALGFPKLEYIHG